MRQRKTIDTWQVWVNYGSGFEHECTEFSYRDARVQRKTYQENCPQYPVSIRRKRDKREDDVTVGGNGLFS